MALPKRKTPKSKQRTRRSHHAARAPQLIRERGGLWRENHRAGADRDSKGRPIEEPQA